METSVTVADVANEIRTEYNVGFEVFRAMAVKSYFLWDMGPCSSLKISRL
jgi:hypothetical protein